MSSRLHRRARDERGFALATTMMVIFISVLLGIPALSLTLGSLHRVASDRNETRALEAADAGADIAVWRMNKLIGPAEASGLVSSTVGAVAQLACITVDVGGAKALSLNSGQGWCAPTAWETLDDNSGGPKQETRYSVSTGIHISLDPTSLIQRRIVATGRVGTVQRRIVLTMRIDPNLSTLALWRRYRYAECSGRQPGSDPDSGCPG
jgi:Tfp pilus assembly protein PilX